MSYGAIKGIMVLYYMAGSVSGQDEANPTF